MPSDTPSAMLVWEDAPDHPGELRAFTPLGGLYTIRGGKAWFDGEGTHLRIGGAGHEFPDLPSARAACEADYRERMSAAGWVPADAIRAEIAWHEAEESRCRREQRGLCLGLLADKHAVAAARLTALLPAQEEPAK